MRSYVLHVKNQDAYNQTFRAAVRATTAQFEKIVSSEVSNFETESFEEVAAYFSKFGIMIDEIKYALEEMDDNGHNTADFGFMGRFLFSSFVGKVH